MRPSYTGVYFVLACIGWMHVHTQNIQCTKGDEDVACGQTISPASMYSKFREYILPRIDPGKVGDVTTVDLDPDVTHTMITRAKIPPIFEIPNFLSQAECDQMIQVAKNEGLYDATMFGESGNFLKQEGSIHTRKGQVKFIPAWKDEVLSNIRKRGEVLAQIPADLVEDSEEIQVGHYGVGGHYHSHWDSSASESGKRQPCCHQTPYPHSVGTCDFCRYVTVLIYLNDVEEGGETAFPVADKLVTHLANITEKHYNLSQYCHEASVVVKPKKGTAIMWYSNHRDPENGWLGKLDFNSLHGGCPVLKGEKWIATLWISAATYDNRYKDTVF